jgi:hypothetical protein
VTPERFGERIAIVPDRALTSANISSLAAARSRDQGDVVSNVYQSTRAISIASTSISEESYAEAVDRCFIDCVVVRVLLHGDGRPGHGDGYDAVVIAESAMCRHLHTFLAV